MIDIENWQKLGEFVSKNLLATIVGISIGGGLISIFYEKFLLPSVALPDAQHESASDIQRIADRAPPSVSRPDAQYETWQIKGFVDLVSANVSYRDVTPSIQPPDLRLMPDGSFTASVLVEVKPDGHREYPTLTFSVPVDYNLKTKRLELPRKIPVVHIFEPGAAPLPGAEDYEAQHIPEKREIHLKKKVVFRPSDEVPWSPTVHAEKTGAEGNQSKEVEK